MSKKIIFLGSPLPDHMIDEYHTMSFNMADNIAQNVMIKGLKEHYGNNLTVITELSKDYKGDIDLGNSVKAAVIPSNDSNKIAYYTSLFINYTKKLNAILKKVDRNTEIIVVTRGSYIFIALPVILMRLLHRLKWVPFIITTVEVPEYGFPLNMISRLSRWTTKRADGMITYVAKSAHDYMPGKPFLEIAYSVDNKLIDLYKKYSTEKPKKFTITYTGSLSNTYNFEYIIQAIRRTGNEYRWVFAGTGVYVDAIEGLASNKEFDVDYLGYISNVEAIKLQKSSHVLLCPRGGNSSKISRYYSKYAASGKLTEYLCSGTPILASDVPSTLDEIRQFITSESGQTVTRIVSDLHEICQNYTNKLKTASRGQLYAFGHFNATYQNKRVYDFLESL